jgi:hypothetical protein
LEGELPDFKHFMKPDSKSAKGKAFTKCNTALNIGKIEGFSSMTNEYDRVYKDVRVLNSIDRMTQTLDSGNSKLEHAQKYLTSKLQAREIWLSIAW